jgi:hypothetical protein
MSKNIVIGNSNPKVIKNALKANTAATSLSILSCNVSYEEAQANRRNFERESHSH